jgi:hypothetical protein
MRWARFILFGILLFSLLLANLITPSFADTPNGTRSPGADVTLSTLTGNQTAKPTDSLSYVFVVNNTGDENDSFVVNVISVHGWIVNWTNGPVGPLESNESATVEVNISVPMGVSPDTVDNLTFTAQSTNDPGVIEDIIVNTTVIEAFIISIDVDGALEKTLSIDPPQVTNYTLTIRNRGNDDITITFKHSTPTIGWAVTFPQFPNKKVTVSKANFSQESIVHVNVSVSAPLDASPGFTMPLNIWGERTDAVPIWYSFQDQENITLNTVVKSNINLNLSPENRFGYAGLNDTIYNFTMQNLGNTDVIIDLVAIRDDVIGASIDIDWVNLRKGELPIINKVRVSAAANAPLGNYSINISATNNATGEFIDQMEIYYIVAPVFNITNISIADSDPLQFKQTVLYATIKNIGFIHARNVTVKFYDGEEKIGETYIPEIDASMTNETKINWTPANNGNRSIRVEISVEGVGNFSEHGTGIAEKSTKFDVKINWEPYYFIIYIIIVIVLGIAVIAALNELRYYSGVPHINHVGENGEEDYDVDDFPEDDEPSLGLEDEEERPFGTYGVTTESKTSYDEPLSYDKPRERKYRPPPEPKREPPRYEPPKQEIAPPIDPETRRVESELRDEIARVQDDLDRTKSQGVDTNNIDQLLSTAKKNLSEGDNTKAKQYVGYASERLKNLVAKRDEATQAIKEAREVLSGMRGSADLTIVENFLVKADSLMKDGDYREAINYAKKAKDRAQRLQRKEMRL